MGLPKCFISISLLCRNGYLKDIYQLKHHYSIAKKKDLVFANRTERNLLKLDTKYVVMTYWKSQQVEIRTLMSLFQMFNLLQYITMH